MSNRKTEKDTEITEAEIIEDGIIEDKEAIREKDGLIEQKKSFKEKLLSADHWLRFLFMVLFGLILSVAGYVMTAVVIMSFFWALLAGQNNEKLRRFGGNLSHFIYQILRFLTYNTEVKPFPFSDWPERESEENPPEK